MAAKEYNADIRVWAPEEENDVDGQNKLIERATEEKPDAILISPSSFTESDQLLKKAKEQGIHIAFIDSYTQEEVQDLTVATDNLEAGQILGRFAKDLVGADDQIAIVSHVKGVSTAVEREKGFRTGLGSLKDNIVDVVYCDSQYDKSYELTKELMKKYPDLKMIAGMNEYSSVGAARAVKAAKAHWDRVAKPLNSLGVLEEDICRIAGVKRREEFSLDKKCIVIMCADNGIVAEGVTQTGQDVTAAVAKNIAARRSCVCLMAACAGAEVLPVDVGDRKSVV